MKQTGKPNTSSQRASKLLPKFIQNMPRYKRRFPESTNQDNPTIEGPPVILLIVPHVQVQTKADSVNLYKEFWDDNSKIKNMMKP